MFIIPTIFFGKLILNSVVWMVFRFFEHHPTIFDYRVGLMASDVKIVEIFFWPSGVLFQESIDIKICT